MKKNEEKQLDFDFWETDRIHRDKSSLPKSFPTYTGLITRVALDAPIDKIYSFSVPDEFSDKLKPGMLVEVPIGRSERKYKGFCLDVSQAKWKGTLKPISNIIDERILFDEKIAELANWLSEYYVAPPGLAISCAIPASVKKVQKKPTRVEPYIISQPFREPEFELNSDQRSALAYIQNSIDRKKFEAILLHGVTASGKTEIYIRAIQNLIKSGRGAIYLVPEIALTAQMIYRLAERFENVAVMHSGLTEARRRATWHAISEGKIQLVLGTRSAIFSPVKNLGLIVIDEEQEPSFKNMQTPRYNTRDLAIKRAQIENVPVVLGSATPALETFYNSKHRSFWHYLWLGKRVADLPMPDVVLVDMYQEHKERKGVHLLSRLLETKIEETLQSGKQIILLLNRRGHSGYVFCPKCSYVIHCPNCKTRLVYHRSSNRLLCHHCNTRLAVPEKCDRCGGKMNKFGIGTQRLEEELERKFPGIKFARMDMDSMTKTSSYEKTLSDFAAGRMPILLGTQMIAKGLDFPNVSLVGVICADIALSMPDFRAGERTFQLLAQVAGRAGRADYAGSVVVQSYNITDPAIQSALNHDYHQFAKKEMYLRKKLSLPPFTRLARIVVRHTKSTQAHILARELTQELQKLTSQLTTGKTGNKHADISIIGPNPTTLFRLRNRYRYQILIRCSSANSMLRFFKEVRQSKQINLFRKEFIIDIDPIDLL